MVTLNDYLYSGHTVLKILHTYEEDLRADALRTGSAVDLAHSDFLARFTGLLEHNDFLRIQSSRIREFYDYMTARYPTLAFTFRGRIKSLIRAEGKFNGYITEYIADHYAQYHTIPTEEAVCAQLHRFRDLIAYRIVISLPSCNLEQGQDPEQEEQRYLFEIAHKLVPFLEEVGFMPEPSGTALPEGSPLQPAVSPYYRDYVTQPKPFGYRSLHITFYDSIAKGHMELQLRTKKMDDVATIGEANHLGYEKRQAEARSRRETVPVGLSREFDQAWERLERLQSMDLSKLDVNMFTAYSEEMMNDGCGFYRGRLITPFEHLSRFQSG